MQECHCRNRPRNTQLRLIVIDRNSPWKLGTGFFYSPTVPNYTPDEAGKSGEAFSDLLRLALEGDQAAARKVFEQLYDYAESLVRWRFSLVHVENLGADLSVEDATQECLAEIWEFCKSNSELPAAPGAFFKTLIINKCRNLLRGARRRLEITPLEELEQEPPAPPQVEMSWDMIRLHRAIAQLPKPKREVVRRYFLKQQTFARIAESMGISPRQAKYTCKTALESLRKKLLM